MDETETDSRTSSFQNFESPHDESSQSSEASSVEDLEKNFVVKIYKQYKSAFYYGMWMAIILSPIVYFLKVWAYYGEDTARPGLIYVFTELVYALIVGGFFLFGFLKRNEIEPADLSKMMYGAVFCWVCGFTLLCLFCFIESRPIDHFCIGFTINTSWWTIWFFFFWQYKKFLELHQEYLEQRITISMQ